MVNPLVILELVERLSAVPAGSVVTVPLGPDDEGTAADTLAAWCARSGNELVDVREGAVTVRRGRTPAPPPGAEGERPPGTRLWMYTNFDCNLACDYCCARSSPQTARRALGVDRVRRLAEEAVGSGVSELILTGGEPFLLPDLDELVAICTAALPTTLLTNGMLFRGHRLERLRRMDRSRLTLQISLDSATPEGHDSHRGHGSWERAVAGIRIAQDEGFRVKVAATLPAAQSHKLGPFHEFLDTLGIAPEDQVIRALAHRGNADAGIELSVESLVPEVTVTADGVYWHPIGADDTDQLITAEIFPLAAAIDEVRRRFTDQRAHADAASQWFPCA
ncbi:Antilisterial bacteriocin subtilosin biosynthesis protein AlbA [Arthrobacter sp. SO5]|uniref:Rv1681 family radical SAM protein n=1 Tax=Arthrobacter sp. SO5 TaxID=1897055 RepID=UPI001E398563|nr:radical SAM protein [Arthrobacter sp. SO5]MCB5275672.1 Antilisterial bacteriocin subtilosin biosynthesis protein AlbA [Arthrobacter sp. SO5]